MTKLRKNKKAFALKENLMMKKILFVAAALAVMFGASAQNENMWVSLRGGASGLMHPQCNGYENFGHTIQGQASAQFGVWITPVFGIGIESVTGFDNGSSAGNFHGKNWVNHTDVYANTKFNLSRLIFGKQRKVEFVPVAGIGWVHGFTYAGHSNDIATKYAVDVNYNFADKWQLNVSPFLAYNLTGNYQGANNPRFDARNAWWGLEAGVTYKFGNGFKICGGYTQADIDALNAQINELRSRQPETRVEVVEKVVEKVVENTVKKVVYQDIVIDFENNSDELRPSEAAKLAGIPKDATVIVTGSATKTGSPDRNDKLSAARAKVVADKIKSNGVKDVTYNSVGTKFNERIAVVKVDVK